MLIIGQISSERQENHQPPPIFGENWRTQLNASEYSQSVKP
jgi:hypothetical protein